MQRSGSRLPFVGTDVTRTRSRLTALVGNRSKRVSTGIAGRGTVEKGDRSSRSAMVSKGAQLCVDSDNITVRAIDDVGKIGRERANGIVAVIVEGD